MKRDLPPVSDIRTLDNALTYTSTLSAIHVGNALLKQTALLLPEVYERFKAQLLDFTKQHNIIVMKEDIPGSVWLRSQLSSKLEHHMAYKCSIMRIGTVIYRYGGDIFHALSVSLGQARNHDSKDKLSEVCLELNSKCQATIKDMIQQDALTPHNIESIDIEKFISKLDPDIWKAISLLTKPSSKKAAKKESQKRNIRRFFCVCVMLFTINSQCSFPLHTLLTDVIETCGGSERLVRLFNRLGICSSPETALRYIQYRVQKRVREGIMTAYPSDCFMIASADNIDYVHHYARVYCGKQQSSWHGTTVQIAQPKPCTLNTNTHTSESEATEANVTIDHRESSSSQLPTNLCKKLYSTNAINFSSPQKIKEETNGSDSDLNFQ